MVPPHLNPGKQLLSGMHGGGGAGRPGGWPWMMIGLSL
jgi:hypothetical protein